MLTSSAIANGAVTAIVAVFVTATKAASSSNSTEGHTYFDTAGATLS